MFELVNQALHALRKHSVLRQHRVNLCAHEQAIVNDRSPLHNGVLRSRWAAPKPGLDWVGNCARKRRASKRPHCQVANGTNTDFTNFANSAKAPGTTPGGNLERHSRSSRSSTIAKFCQQHCLPCL
jgi:hypothetical protein